jgi:hypothetical protein
MPTTRTPVFELHILPMIRAMDRAHMQQFFGDGFDLWSYDFLRENAERVLDRLNLDMPTPETGGLWPQEWIDLFRRWTVSGFKHLQLGTAEYEVVRTDDVVELLASGTFPASGYLGWLQLELVTDAARSYVLYFESPDTPTADPAESFFVGEQWVAGATPQSVFVRDATGTRKLAVPDAS